MWLSFSLPPSGFSPIPHLVRYISHPIIGRIPWALIALEKEKAPCRLPWSVSASALVPLSAAYLARSSGRQYPSRKEKVL